ncbi:MAG: hypothetical protein HY544_04660 [Candidatus Diapherotrites archaeon]|uniref:Uncharacterized protein n=1 Tax=Candidatus Iainarchaeum sp. TaxID=3101447 RepID=A0A8T3YRK2_9ARCH|nr:hypothetical protein [Candidatus Diapherotrites archaeon]
MPVVYRKYKRTRYDPPYRVEINRDVFVGIGNVNVNTALQEKLGAKGITELVMAMGNDRAAAISQLKSDAERVVLPVITLFYKPTWEDVLRSIVLKRRLEKRFAKGQLDILIDRLTDMTGHPGWVSVMENYSTIKGLRGKKLTAAGALENIGTALAQKVKPTADAPAPQRKRPGKPRYRELTDIAYSISHPKSGGIIITFIEGERRVQVMPRGFLHGNPMVLDTKGRIVMVQGDKLVFPHTQEKQDALKSTKAASA